MQIVELVRLARPFTLLPPILGIVSGAAVACSIETRLAAEPLQNIAARVALAALCAMILNAASNSINQLFDLEIDRINKPHRPLPSGSLTKTQVLVWSAIFYITALIVAWPLGLLFFLAIVVTTMLTLAYSVPPLRLKRRPVLSNLTIAAARGLLLPVVGYAALATPDNIEIWYLAVTSAVFIFGAAIAKDFGDTEGDLAGAVVTLPILLGAEKAARLMRPLISVPLLLLFPASSSGLLTGNAFVWAAGSVTLAALAWNTAGRAIKLFSSDDRESLTVVWRRLYLIMIAVQVLVATAYLIPA
jgi:chlorophyll/bacteriochlorophyll a synthase